MSGVSLPPLELSTNKSLLQEQLRQPSKARRRKPSLLSTEQLSLLLSLLAIGVYQKAEAQGTEAELIITAQNNLGEVTQLILSGGKLYILTGGSGTNRFEVELGDGQRAADIITDFTTNDRLVLTNPHRANNPSITDYGSLADLLEADSTDTDDLNLIYNPDPDNQADEVVLVLDDFLATNDLDDITLTQIKLP